MKKKQILERIERKLDKLSDVKSKGIITGGDIKFIPMKRPIDNDNGCYILSPAPGKDRTMFVTSSKSVADKIYGTNGYIMYEGYFIDTLK